MSSAVTGRLADELPRHAAPSTLVIPEEETA
jgi:hypothetical protein